MMFIAEVKASVTETFVDGVHGTAPRLYIVVPLDAMQWVTCMIGRPNGWQVYADGHTQGLTFEDLHSEVQLSLDRGLFRVGERVSVEVLTCDAVIPVPRGQGVG